MANVLIRNVPEPILKALKRRAEQNRRSLQQEIVAMLEAAARASDRQAALDTAVAVFEQLRRSRRDFSDSALGIREDRER